MIAIVSAPLMAADEIRYDYLDFGYIFADELETDNSVTNGNDEDLEGLLMEGSAELTDYVYVRGTSQAMDIDSGHGPGGDTALNLTSLAVGGYLPLLSGSTPLHLTGDISYERFDLVDEADGWGATGGLRWRPVRNLVFKGNIGWRGYGSFLGETLDGPTYGIGAQYDLTEQLAVTADWKLHDLELDNAQSDDFEINTFSFGLRGNFNR